MRMKLDGSVKDRIDHLWRKCQYEQLDVAGFMEAVENIAGESKPWLAGSPQNAEWKYAHCLMNFTDNLSHSRGADGDVGKALNSRGWAAFHEEVVIVRSRPSA